MSLWYHHCTIRKQVQQWATTLETYSLEPEHRWNWFLNLWFKLNSQLHISQKFKQSLLHIITVVLNYWLSGITPPHPVMNHGKILHLWRRVKESKQQWPTNPVNVKIHDFRMVCRLEGLKGHDSMCPHTEGDWNFLRFLKMFQGE